MPNNTVKMTADELNVELNILRGNKKGCSLCPDGQVGCEWCWFDYIGDIASAMPLLDEVKKGDGTWSLFCNENKYAAAYDCRIFPGHTKRSEQHTFIAHGKTPAQAISLCFYEWKTGTIIELIEEEK